MCVCGESTPITRLMVGKGVSKMERKDMSKVKKNGEIEPF